VFGCFCHGRDNGHCGSAGTDDDYILVFVVQFCVEELRLYQRAFEVMDPWNFSLERFFVVLVKNQSLRTCGFEVGKSYVVSRSE
jgi:hypothetical protein